MLTVENQKWMGPISCRNTASPLCMTLKPKQYFKMSQTCTSTQAILLFWPFHLSQPCDSFDETGQSKYSQYRLTFKGFYTFFLLIFFSRAGSFRKAMRLFPHLRNLCQFPPSLASSTEPVSQTAAEKRPRCIITQAYLCLPLCVSLCQIDATWHVIIVV